MKAGKNPRRIALAAILLAVLAIVACAAARLAAIQEAGNGSDRLYRDLEQSFGAKPAVSGVEDLDFVPFEYSYQKLLEQNKDARGWIYIENVMSYPVVQGETNGQYMETLFDGSPGFCGTPFIDASMDEGLDGRYCIVYGHNIDGGRFFGALQGYRERDFFEQHPHAHVFIADKHYKYEVFAAFDTEIDSRAFLFDPYMDDAAEFGSWAKGQSLHRSGREIKEGDYILTLSTCTPQSDPYYRFVVLLVREGEVMPSAAPQ